MGDLPAIANARPVSRGILHIPAQLLNVDGTVDPKGDQEGQQEQSERNDRWAQCDAVPTGSPGDTLEMDCLVPQPAAPMPLSH
jgi:hypothetical protein